MSSLTMGVPALAAFAGFHRFTVDDYHRMIQSGVLDEDDAVELLEGYVVNKMPHNPPYATALQRTRKRIEALLPAGWDTRIQLPVTLPDSEPEPDIAVAQGDESTYSTRHPGPADLGLVVEVSDSTLTVDRDHKGRIYARAGIAVYWIVNLVDRQVEVNTGPTGPTAAPAYGQRQVFAPGSSVPLVLNGALIGQISVDELIA
jgi:Uma2 family endonuclease